MYDEFLIFQRLDTLNRINVDNALPIGTVEVLRIQQLLDFVECRVVSDVFFTRKSVDINQISPITFSLFAIHFSFAQSVGINTTGFYKFVGEWQTTELAPNKIQIDYTYTLHSDMALLYPLNWLFAKNFWKTYMKRVLENIRQMTLNNEPYLYE